MAGPTKEKEAAIARLHSSPCPVPMWEMVGRHFAHPKPICICGAESSPRTLASDIAEDR